MNNLEILKISSSLAKSLQMVINTQSLMPAKRWNQEEESVQVDSKVTTWLLFCQLLWIAYANKRRKTAKGKMISRRWKKQQGESMLSNQPTSPFN